MIRAIAAILCIGCSSVFAQCNGYDVQAIPLDPPVVVVKRMDYINTQLPPANLILTAALTVRLTTRIVWSKLVTRPPPSGWLGKRCAFQRAKIFL